MEIIVVDDIVVSKEPWASGIGELSLEKLNIGAYALKIDGVGVAAIACIEPGGSYFIRYTENECVIFGTDGGVLERKDHPQPLPRGFALRLDRLEDGTPTVKIVDAYPFED